MGKRRKVSPALIVGLVGNMLALTWPTPLFFVQKGTYDETLPGMVFALVSFLLLGLGFGGCVVSLFRGTTVERIAGVIGLALCLLPLPLYLYAINLLCNSHGYCSGD